MILDAGGGELRPDVAHKRAQERQNEGSHTRRGGGTKHHPVSEGPPRQGRAAFERAGKGSVRGAGGPSLCPGSAHIGRRKPIGRRLVCEGPGGSTMGLLAWGFQPRGKGRAKQAINTTS